MSQRFYYCYLYLYYCYCYYYCYFFVLEQRNYLGCLHRFSQFPLPDLFPPLITAVVSEHTLFSIQALHFAFWVFFKQMQFLLFCFPFSQTVFLDNCFICLKSANWVMSICCSEILIRQYQFRIFYFLSRKLRRCFNFLQRIL